MRTSRLLLIVTLAAASAAACARARAQVTPAIPELAPPPPPPRIVETYPLEPVPTITPGPIDGALSVPPVKDTPPPPPRTETPKPAPAERTEPASATPSLTLKPAPGIAGQTEASIRALLERAARDLQRVNYAALNADGRAQFDSARRFIQQSEQALKLGNLVFAGKLADKAATMAAVLVR